MRNLKFLALLVFFIAMKSPAQEITRDTIPQPVGKYTAKRSPLLAAALSLVTVGFGGGQYYNKQYIKGGIVSGINTGVILWLVTRKDSGEAFDGLGEAILGTLIIGANWIYSVIDAPISADHINKRYGLYKKVSFAPVLQQTPWDNNSR